jgi:hypothetical protein
VRSDNGKDGPESQSAAIVAAKAERKRKREFIAESPIGEAELDADIAILQQVLADDKRRMGLPWFVDLGHQLHDAYSDSSFSTASSTQISLESIGLSPVALPMFLEREAVYLRSEIEKLQAELELFQTRLAANEEKQKQVGSVPSNMMEREVSRDAH